MKTKTLNDAQVARAVAEQRQEDQTLALAPLVWKHTIALLDVCERAIETASNRGGTYVRIEHKSIRLPRSVATQVVANATAVLDARGFKVTAHDQSMYYLLSIGF